MANCINVNSVQYRELNRLSTLPEILLKAEIAKYQDSHNGRFPKADEIPGTNSLEAITEDLRITQEGTSTIADILSITGSQSLEEASVIINDKYRDLDIELIPINKTAIVNIKERPSLFKYVENPKHDFKFTDSAIFITKSLNKMAKTMGINIIPVSKASIESEGILKQIPEAAQVSAFIYNGNIYINTDLASIDAPIHELMHILLGAMKFKNPELYYELVNSVEQLPNIEDFTLKYSNRTRSDLLEEVFVEEFSKYLSGLENEMVNLDSDVLYQIHYDISRTLDTILMGDNSVSAIDDETLFNSTLREVAEIVNSSTMVNTAHGFLEEAMIHRVLANVKQELLENGDLKEEC